MSSSPPRAVDETAAAAAVQTKAEPQTEATANGEQAAKQETNEQTDAAAAAVASTVPVPAPAPVVASDPAAERRMAENATAIPGADGKLVIPTKLFVGALSNNVDDARLRACFEPFGSIIECKVQRDKFTQQSRNFGFVVFADAASAAAVINSPATATLELDGKRMNIRYAEALGQGGRGDQRVRATFGEPAVPYGSGYGARGYPGVGGVGGGFDRERDAERRDREMRQTGQTYKVFVGHLDQSISDADLKEYFSQFGNVAEATVMKERGTGRSRGFAFLHFTDSRSVESCFAQREHTIKGFAVVLERSKPPAGGAGGYGGGGGGGYGGGYPPRDSYDRGGYGDPRDSRGGYGGGGYGGDYRRDDRGDDYRRDDRRDDRDRFAPRPYGVPPAADPYGYPQAAPYGAPYGAAPHPAAYRDDRARAPAPAAYGAPGAYAAYPAAAPYAAAPAAADPYGAAYMSAAPPAARGYDAYGAAPPAPAAYGAAPAAAYPPSGTTYGAPAAYGAPPQPYR